MKTKNTNRIRRGMRFLFLFLLARVAMAAPAPHVVAIYAAAPVVNQAR